MPYEKTKIYIIVKIGNDIRLLSNEHESYYTDPLDQNFQISYNEFRDTNSDLLYHISAESQSGESYLNHAVSKLAEIKESPSY